MSAIRREDGTKMFRDVIARRTGLHFDDGKLPFLDDILERRLSATGKELGSYIDALSAPHRARDEVHELAKELTVGETYFFRHMAQFRAFQHVVDGSQGVGFESRRLRVLSAGCASGEEAYSLAILLRERKLMAPNFDYEVHACDLNPAVLARAARGRYSRWSLRETTEEYRKHWFTRDDNDYVLQPSIRDSVVFTPYNLVEDLSGSFAAGTFDVIFCRNVIMYFTAETMRRVVAGLARLLTPHGHLFLGHAESLRGLSNDFHLRCLDEAFYYQRKQSLGAHGALEPLAASQWGVAASTSARNPGLSSSAAASDSGKNDATWVEVVQRAAERVKLLTERRESAPVGSADVEAVVLPPVVSNPGFRGAIRLLEQERFADALEHLADATSPTTSDPEVLLLRAALLTHQGALGEAAVVARQLLELDELNAGAHYLLALCCEGSGANDGAMEHDRMATHLDPTFAMSRLHLGLLARRAGDVEDAERELRAASELLLREDPSRLLLFGGGFRREGLVALCNAELRRLRGER